VKRLVALTLAIITLLATAVAIVPVKVIVGNKVIETPAGDVQAQIINNSTLVPMRAIFEALNSEVEWIPSSKTIVATKGPKVIIMKIGSLTMTVSDGDTGETKEVTLPVAPQSINAADKKYGARTMVPLRAVSESFDMQVDWDGKTYTVTVKSKK